MNLNTLKNIARAEADENVKSLRIQIATQLLPKVDQWMCDDDVNKALRIADLLIKREKETRT